MIPPSPYAETLFEPQTGPRGQAAGVIEALPLDGRIAMAGGFEPASNPGDVPVPGLHVGEGGGYGVGPIRRRRGDVPLSLESSAGGCGWSEFVVPFRAGEGRCPVVERQGLNSALPHNARQARESRAASAAPLARAAQLTCGARGTPDRTSAWLIHLEASRENAKVVGPEREGVVRQSRYLEAQEGPVGSVGCSRSSELLA